MIDDFGAHRKCALCGKIEHQKKMLNYNDRFFCSIQCKVKQERYDDDSLYRHLRPDGKSGGRK